MARITIEPCLNVVRASIDGTVLGESTAALILRETGYGPQYYLPAADIRIDLLRSSDSTTHCPHKGAAEYFHAKIGDTHIHDAAWSYPEPIEDAADIRGHIAFYADKVRIEIG